MSAEPTRPAFPEREQDPPKTNLTGRSVTRAELPRCGTCRHWTPDPEREPNGDCAALGAGATAQIGAWSYGYDEFGFTSPPDFGCTLWAGRPPTEETEP